jgi:hypothetical protein
MIGTKTVQGERNNYKSSRTCSGSAFSGFPFGQSAKTIPAFAVPPLDLNKVHNNKAPDRLPRKSKTHRNTSNPSFISNIASSALSPTNNLSSSKSSQQIHLPKSTRPFLHSANVELQKEKSDTNQSFESLSSVTMNLDSMVNGDPYESINFFVSPTLDHQEKDVNPKPTTNEIQHLNTTIKEIIGFPNSDKKEFFSSLKNARTPMNPEIALNKNEKENNLSQSDAENLGGISIHKKLIAPNILETKGKTIYSTANAEIVDEINMQFMGEDLKQMVAE